jgi:hypothetical protein
LGAGYAGVATNFGQLWRHRHQCRASGNCLRWIPRSSPGRGNENLFNGIAKTVDGGHTWTIVFKESTHGADNLKGTWIEQRAAPANPNIWFDAPYSLGVAPADPRVVYATDLFRSYRTLDGGASWLEVNSRQAGDGDWTSRGLDVTTDYGVQFDPFDSKHIFIDYTDIGLFASNDGGLTWQSSSAGIPRNGATRRIGWPSILRSAA